MKITNAIWEKRNLGVDTIEITFELNDSLKEIDEILKKLTSEYVVLKIPTCLSEVTCLVQDHGYRYIEDMVYFVNNLGPVKMSPVQKRLYDSIKVEKMTHEDILSLNTEIRRGIFDSDRVFLDPYFTHELAAQRYINWIADEKEKGTEFLKYIYKENTIGFFALNEIGDGHYTSFIGGIYKDYRKGGIGSIVKVPEEVKKRNGKKVSTSVSTNNIMQIKSLIINGYVPEGIFHTFIKHF